MAGGLCDRGAEDGETNDGDPNPVGRSRYGMCHHCE